MERLKNVIGTIAAIGILAAQMAHAEEARQFSQAVIIRFEGPITPMLQQYLYRKLETAKQAQADLVILEIDSPGGYMIESLEIAEKLRDLDWARTVAYVPREALSGAAIAALGCDEIVLRPRAVIGDAGPVFQGEDALFRHAPEKIRSHLAAAVRGLAKSKGRAPALAEAMVDMNLVVYQAKNSKTGEETFLSQREIDSSDHPGQWDKIKPVHESGNGHFLEVSGTRAVEVKLADATVDGHEELKARYHLTKEPLVFEPAGVDTAVYILNQWWVTGLLFVVGLIALYVEFCMPGTMIGGLIAGLCFAIFFWSRFLGGTADWLDVILFAAGAVFLGVEIFVLPGFGVAGLTGILLLVASLILASQRFILPGTSQQLSSLGTTLGVLVGSGVVFIIAAAILSRYLHVVPVFNRLALIPPTDARGDLASDSEQKSTASLQVGAVGVADSPLRPSGRARFGDKRVDVTTDGTFIATGTPVRIIEQSGRRIVVTAHEEGARA
jgi:membrane-bound serine protease (ClpP class)